MPNTPAPFSFEKWQIKGSEDFLQVVNSSGTVVGWIDNTGTSQGALSGSVGPAGPSGTGEAQFGHYLLSVSAGTTSAQNLFTGSTDYSGTDAAAVIRSVIGNMPNGGTILFQNGVYNLNSLVQETTGGFTQYYAIGIPPGGPTQYAAWEFIGESLTPIIDQFGSTVQTGGVVFNLTTTAENSVAAGSVIFGIWARPDTVNGIGATIKLRNIDVRLPSNQRGNETAIDTTQALLIDFDHVVADFNIAQASLSFPVAGSKGLYGITSTASSKEENCMKLVYACGHDVGFDIQSEHTTMTNCFALNCNHGVNYGVRGSTLSAPSSWTNVGVVTCARGLTLGTTLASGTVLSILGLSFEDAASGSFAPVYHATELSAGHTFGFITASRSVEGTGNVALTNIFDGAGGTRFLQFSGNTLTQPS